MQYHGRCMWPYEGEELGLHDKSHVLHAESPVPGISTKIISGSNNLGESFLILSPWTGSIRQNIQY